MTELVTNEAPFSSWPHEKLATHKRNEDLDLGARLLTVAWSHERDTTKGNRRIGRMGPPSRRGGGERGAPGSCEAGKEEGVEGARGLGRAATKDLRGGGVGLREVWRQAASAGGP